MDYQEAIESHINECRHRIDVIRNYMNTNGDADKDVCNKNIDVLKIAISAMQELEMYKDNKLCLIPENVYGKQCDELDEYKRLGTLEEVRDAVEKQKAKGPIYEGDGYAPDGTFVWDEWICPNCGHSFEVEYEEHDYCPNCGQHILWEVEDER